MNKDREHREAFYILDQESYEQLKHDQRLMSAADRAAQEVDFETIGMFMKASLPLPARLKKILDKSNGVWR